MSRKIRVLIDDDSSLIRQILTQILNTAGDKHLMFDRGGVRYTCPLSDGTSGRNKTLNAGELAIAQNEVRSVVWDMPGSAIKPDGAQDGLPLEWVSAAISHPAQQVGASMATTD